MESIDKSKRQITAQRVEKLRGLFKEHGLHGYVVPHNDEYLNEYIPEHAKRLEYITGFTGSSGIAFIFESYCLFFTDGRYTEASKRELNHEIFQSYDQKDLQMFLFDKYLNLDVHYKIGYDPKLFTAKTLDGLFKKHKTIELIPVTTNLIDEIWQDKPCKTITKIYTYNVEFAGECYKGKIKKCRDFLTQHNAETIIITSSDSVCWLLNIRGGDLNFSPLALTTAIISHDKTYLFTDIDKVTMTLRSERPDVIILPQGNINEVIRNSYGKILIDHARASSFFIQTLCEKEVENIQDPCQLWKACKNPIEINHAKDAHIKDAVALCEVLTMICAKYNVEHYTEYDIGLLLTQQRKYQVGYVCDSFPTICGFKENGAIIHYNANKTTAKPVKDTGILLIDSGGQYIGATTDVTRVIAINAPTQEQKARYTEVLKGHIALSGIKFPSGITGGNLDVLARQFLWHGYNDYAHGTGHGVGNFLNVHEGPQNISLRSNVTLQEGMIVSNEPGYYLPGSFGIRIENLMFVKKSINEQYFEFETLTLVPYEKALIDVQKLTEEEISFINRYYNKIQQLVYPLLSKRAQDWFVKQML